MPADDDYMDEFEDVPWWGRLLLRLWTFFMRVAWGYEEEDPEED